LYAPSWPDRRTERGLVSLDDVVVRVITMMLVGVVVVIGMGVYTVARYRVPLRGVMALGAAVVYAVSPVDLAPEAALGPVGLVDDVGLFLAAMNYAKQLGTIRQSLRRSR
jgi:uncharacterized membrane protein YkvA (DUF1232 family)